MKNCNLKRSFFTGLIFLMICLFTQCGGDINSVGDNHFTNDGHFIRDSIDSDSSVSVPFAPVPPSSIKFFVEVSGSMNGFFRANAPTKFKEDVWRVVSYFAPVSEGVTILTNDGSMGASISIPAFQTQMNTGAFISAASTRVPVMLQTIINSIDVESGEVAVLISDMKYSPVGVAAPKVLLTQYSTDISTIFGNFNKAICLVGATSNYLDKKGFSVADMSPYYFLILGNQEQVAYLRNGISTLIENNGNFIDNIESGFDYGSPVYDFGVSENCVQLDNEPTFTGFDEDTCTIKLKVNLANYRWATARVDIFPKAFQCKALFGSELSIGNIEYFIQNITDKKLDRTAWAIVDLKIYNMPMDSEVIEWTLQLPDMDVIKFAPYLDAEGENDFSKSYSLENFIKGMFYGGITNKTLKPNYILISKNS